MRLRYKLGLLIVTLGMAACFMTYQSYALWIVNLKGEENIVETGCFQVTYEEVNTPISLNNTYPMSDQKGLSSTPYTFKIKNTCSVSASYSVTLNTLTTNTMSKDKIKYAISKGVPTSGINLGSNTNLNTDITSLNIENLDESIIIETGTLENQNDEVTYNVYLWIDETAGNEVQNTKFESSINIISSAIQIPPSMTEANKEYILSKAIEGQIIEDDETPDHNLRYIGENPNNYVSFNNELWRIIGIMNNIDDGNGKKESRIKLIRNESIGKYSWDTSDSTVNDGDGVNEWSESDVMKLLNPGYESESVGGSLYWNRGSGLCYNAVSNAKTNCSFTSSGLSTDAQNMIESVKWNTGTYDGVEYTERNMLTNNFYELERSTNTGKICTSSISCNDTVLRTTSWIGKIGLMYPSDYGYATSGGETTARTTCLNTLLYNWENSNVSDCINNNWLFKIDIRQYTMTPGAYEDFASTACLIYSDGNEINGPVICEIAGNGMDIFPSLYLKSNVKILDDGSDGSQENPFHLSL